MEEENYPVIDQPSLRVNLRTKANTKLIFYEAIERKKEKNCGVQEAKAALTAGLRAGSSPNNPMGPLMSWNGCSILCSGRRDHFKVRMANGFKTP